MLRKSFYLPGNNLISQEIISFHRKTFPFIGSHFLSQEIIRISWEPGSQVPQENPTLGCAASSSQLQTWNVDGLWTCNISHMTVESCTKAPISSFQSCKNSTAWRACSRNIWSSPEHFCQSPAFRLSTGSKDLKAQEEY